jgi:biopolymer transport protein ExbD
MRTFLMMLLAFAISAPLFAQETKKEEPAKEEKKEEPAKEEEPKREMTEDGKKLYADFELVNAKYYEIVLAKVKANEPYKSDEVWNEAVKEAKNAKYKDGTEFHDAITKMKAKDRAFKKDVNALSNKSAKDFATAVEVWSKEKK